jgi:predicted GTPase
MPIIATTPTTRTAQEAVSAKTFSDSWAGRIVIVWPKPSDTGLIRIDLSPYDAATGEVMLTEPGEPGESIQVRGISEALAEVPEVAVAMESILAAITAIRDWQAAQAELAAEPETETETETE